MSENNSIEVELEVISNATTEIAEAMDEYTAEQARVYKEEAEAAAEAAKEAQNMAEAWAESDVAPAGEGTRSSKTWSDVSRQWAESDTEPDGVEGARSSKTWSDVARQWAESDTEPDGVEGAKSSKTWAEESAASAAAAEKSAEEAAASAVTATEQADRSTEAADSAEKFLEQMELDLSSKADIDSPTFTGTPKAPTPGSNADSTQIATVGYVEEYGGSGGSLSGTVGSDTIPIWLDNGELKASSKSLNNYLPLSGGTMTGNLIQNNLYLNDGVHTRQVINMYDDGDGDTNYGSELVIGAAGNTFIGAGESQTNLRTTLQSGTSSGESYGQTSEQMYVCSDNNIYFYSTCNTIANRLGIVFDTSGNLRPLVTGSRSLGSSSYYWNTAYINTVYTSKIGTSTVGGTAKPIYLNGGAPTAISSTVGGTAKPIYSNAGTLTAISDTVGSTSKPVYLNGGTIAALSATVGGTAKPIYSNAGTLTAISSTVGGTATPVYLNAGTITKCSYSFSSSNCNCMGNDSDG